ncbi:MAG: hypothetical protein U1E15_12670 [Hyphomicrobiales bacterium]
MTRRRTSSSRSSDVQADTTIAQDMRDRMVEGAHRHDPSDNNKKITEDLSKDSAYADKLKQLDRAGIMTLLRSERLGAVLRLTLDDDASRNALSKRR